MVDVFAFIMLGMALLSIVLGFFALLKQKTYLDPNSHATDVEIPFVGRMKTNYPALVFAVLGFGLAYMTWEKVYRPHKVEWYITGWLVADESVAQPRWQDGTIKIIPTTLKRANISDKGAFEIVIDIEEGKEFEDEIEAIDFSIPEGSRRIEPAAQYRAREEGRESLLQSATKTTREFGRIRINPYEGG